MGQRRNNILNFYNAYLNLTEMEWDRFAKIANKLLDKNFLIYKKDSDRSDFLFCAQHRSLFDQYFSIMDYQVTLNQSDQVISLSTQADRNRMRLRRNETLVLLILRLLYYKKSKEVSFTGDILVSFSEIRDEIESTRKTDFKINATERSAIFRMLKSKSLIDFPSGVKWEDDSRVLLYPTILRVVGMDDLNELEQKINALTKGAEDDEDIDQDSLD